MPERRLAIPLFAVGVFMGIFLSHLFLNQEAIMKRNQGTEQRLLNVKLVEEPEENEVHLNSLRHNELGPELWNRSWWEEFDSKRTLYVQPYTGMANTLQAMGSVLTIAYEQKMNVIFVFDPAWFGQATWADLFSYPIVNFTHRFPDGEINIKNTKSCKHGDPPFKWADAQVYWTENPKGPGEIGCVTTCCWREPPFPEQILWFYRSLRPSGFVQYKIDTFKRKHHWDDYQWIGVHVRRTDNVETMKGLMKFHTVPALRDAVNLSSADSMLPTKNYLKVMDALLALTPLHKLGFYQVFKPIRFFLATDKDETKQPIIDHFGPGIVASFDKGMDGDILRRDAWGMQSGIIDMFLLASCKVVIGTPFSTFTEAASYIGGNLLLEPDFEYSIST